MLVCASLLCALFAASAARAQSGDLQFFTYDAEHYRSVADRIIQSARAGNRAMHKLEELCDDIGHRLTGSPAHDLASDWAVRTMQQDGLENCRPEPLTVPRWVRGRESAELLEPSRRPLVMMGLGFSIGTPPGGLTADVLVVRDKEELDRRASEAAGKIVLFSYPMIPPTPGKPSGYGDAVRFRSSGATWAAEKGAVACLIRSVTTRSLRSAHTGMVQYDEGKRRIPAAALSTEDADQLARLAARGKRIVVTLNMEARFEADATSSNAIGELRGRERPDEIVIVSGHLDSWDVGQGAMDDGAGCVMSMEAAALLKRLNLIPRRTIRVVLWAGEENGLFGAKHYAKQHAAELSKHAAAIESDSGAFKPEGFSVLIKDEKMKSLASQRLKFMLEPLSPIGATKGESGYGGADISVLRPAGVPLFGMDLESSAYFDYHHTEADTYDKIKPQDMTDDVAALAYFSYLLADLPTRIDAPDAK